MKGRARATAVNLLIAMAVIAALGGVLEAVCRALETAPATARHEVQEWQPEAPGEHFYTMSTDNLGWPPWQEFNRDGLRDRRHAVQKTPGIFRSMFLGDSVTAGIGLARDEAFPRVLETRYEAGGVPVEVFSVALWGWSTRQERIAYRRIGRKYAPDEVVLAVCLNDIQELEHQLVRPPALLVALHERSALVRRVVGARQREVKDVEALVLGRRGFDVFFSEVLTLRDEVRADGARFALMLFPYRFQVEPGAPSPAAQEAIGRFCREHEIPFLDLLPELRDLSSAAFIDANHLSAEGARRVAGVLLEKDLLTRPKAYADVLGSAASSGSRLAGATVEERRAAAWAVGHARPVPADAVTALRAALHDDDPGVVVNAARALGTIGRDATAALPDLLALLGHTREDVRAQAARAAWDVGVTAAQADALLARVDSDDEYVRHFAVWAAGQIGAGGQEAVPALLAMLEKEDGHAPGPAAVSLRRLAVRDVEIVKTIARGLRSADAAERARAARHLGQLGPVAAPAVPDLTRACGDAAENVRAEAVIALGRIADAKAVAALVERLRKDGGWVREEAARALGRLGPSATQAVPDLMLALQRDDPPVRRQAARALGRMGAQAAMAVPALKAALGDREEAVRDEARRALAELAAS